MLISKSYNFLKLILIFLVIISCKFNNKFYDSKLNSLSITLPNNEIINGIKTYDDFESYEKSILSFLPKYNLNLNFEIRNKKPYLNEKLIFIKNKKGIKERAELNIVRMIENKQLKIKKILDFNQIGCLMEGEYDNKSCILKVFGAPRYYKNKRYKAEVAEELTRHIFVNNVDMNIGPEIYKIIKDEKNNIYLIMEKININISKLKKDPYKWIKVTYKNLLKLHDRNFCHTDLNSNNLLGYKFLDFAYLDNKGSFFEKYNIFDPIMNDVSRLAYALLNNIYIGNVKDDPELKKLSDSLLYELITKKIYFKNVFEILKKRNKADSYTKFLMDVSLNETKKYENAKIVLKKLEKIKQLII